VLRTDVPDYRFSSEPVLLDALRSRDALAFAEACHRTLPAAHACARRLLSRAADAEALLRTVYLELWTSPPQSRLPGAPQGAGQGTGLERWIRTRCFELAAEELREAGSAPAAPSVAALLPGVPAPGSPRLDATERMLAALPEAERLAVVRAHDAGIPPAEQDDPQAAPALERGLIALAAPGRDDPTEAPAGIGPLADWVLGLADPDRAGAVERAVSADAAVSTYARLLRRGRSRLEGLPPAPDLAPRVLAAALAGVAPRAVGGAVPTDRTTVPRSALDEGPDEGPHDAAPEAEAPEAEAAVQRPAPGEDEAAGIREAAAAADEPAEGAAHHREALRSGQEAEESGAAIARGDASPAEGALVEAGEDMEASAPAKRSVGRRLLRALGMLLILAGGAALGLYIMTALLLNP
jgi:DNA-directed RNA polymerase specialized sigma24 family protein